MQVQVQKNTVPWALLLTILKSRNGLPIDLDSAAQGGMVGRSELHQL